MIDNSNLPKDVEEQIQSLASDVYIQVEEKLTNLISSAVKAELSKNNDQQNKALSDKEQSLQNDFSNKQQQQAAEVEKLKKELADKKADEETAKQNFQVQLTQNTINYTETIESLEKQLASAKQQSAKTSGDIESSTKNLEVKLLEAEQKLDARIHEVDGLNGRIMVLTEQEQSLNDELKKAKAQIQVTSAKHEAAIVDAKKQADASSKKDIDGFAEKLKVAEDALVKAKADALQDSDKAVKALQEQITQLTAQAKQDLDSKGEIQQQLAELQKTVDTEKDKAKQQTEAHQAAMTKLNEEKELTAKTHAEAITKLNAEKELTAKTHAEAITKSKEQDSAEKERQTADLQAEKTAHQETKTLQKTAQDAIIELNKENKDIKKKVETDEKELKRFEYEVSTLTEQLKVAQDNQEKTLQRFNNNRDKQEAENTKVRETIKFLRDENHELLTASEEQKTTFTEQISELEHKVTEYRLKFEYAQKQLAKV